MALRGIFLSHETVRLWSQKIGTDVALKFRARRRGKCGKKWNMDVTYLKIKGKETAFPDAIKKSLGNDVKHCDSKYMNNRMEQHHRGRKSRANVMKGFKDSWCAMIFCHVFEEVQQFFYMPNKTTAERRRLFEPKFHEFSKIAYKAV